MIYFKFKRVPCNKGSQRNILLRILSKIYVSLSANPDFEDKIKYVALWVLEYDNENNNVVNREIGLDVNGKIIVRMPDERNYGYWSDTNCDLEFFLKEGIEEISQEEFESLWKSEQIDW